MRALAIIPIGFLSGDALLILYSCLSLGRPALVMSGVACALVAVLVGLSWRRYRRAIAELEQARRDMRAEVDSIRALLRDKQLHYCAACWSSFQPRTSSPLDASSHP